MSNCDRLDRRFYGVVGVEAYLVHKAVQPVAGEVGFNFTKDCLYRIELGAVAHIINDVYIQTGPPLPQVFGLVDVKLVHEDCDRFSSVPLPELLEEVEKGLLVDRLGVSLAQAHAVLLSH